MLTNRITDGMITVIFFVHRAFLVCKSTSVYIINELTDIIEVIDDKSFDEQ